MPRETQTEKNNNPYYYESIQCEKCGSIESLRMHHHSKDKNFQNSRLPELVCLVCANDLMAEAAKEDEESNVIGRIYDEDRADENRLEYLLQERAL